jgi:hypothetical protein
MLLSENDRLHFTIQNRTLILMVGTTSKISVPITPDLFRLIHKIRSDVADTLVEGVQESDDESAPVVDNSDPLLLLRQAKMRQTRSIPCG